MSSLKEQLRYGEIQEVADSLNRDYREVRRAIISYPSNPGRMSDKTFSEIITKALEIVDARKKSISQLKKKANEVLTEEKELINQ